MNEMLQVTLHIRDTGNSDELISKDKATSLGNWLGIWRATAESFEWPAVESAIDRLETRLKTGSQFIMLLSLCAVIPDERDDVVVSGRFAEIKARISRYLFNDLGTGLLACISHELDLDDRAQ
jgi:hypothetical protein